MNEYNKSVTVCWDAEQSLILFQSRKRTLVCFGKEKNFFPLEGFRTPDRPAHVTAGEHILILFVRQGNCDL